MRKIVAAALLLVACEPAETLEGAPATSSNPSSPGTEPVALSANRDLSVEISIPSISGLSPKASQEISHELAAVKAGHSARRYLQSHRWRGAKALRVQAGEHQHQKALFQRAVHS